MSLGSYRSGTYPSSPKGLSIYRWKWEWMFLVRIVTGIVFLFRLLTWVVLKPLAHLLSVGGEDETVHDQVLVGGFVEQCCAQDSEGVEPPSCLRGKSTATKKSRKPRIIQQK